MSNVRVLKNEWATPEDVADTIKLLQERCKEHGFISVSIVAEDRRGRVHTFSSRTDNRFAVASQFMCMAMELLGFSKSK